MADVRALERRKTQGMAGSISQDPSQRVPAAGEPRRLWLRQRLVQLIQEEMEVCPVRLGVQAVAFLELFERRTGEAFSDTPGALVASRVRGIAKVLENVAREVAWDPPLEMLMVRGTMLWNRRPRVAADVEAWRKARESSEAFAAPVPRLREQMSAADGGLVRWIKDHKHLVPTEVEKGESGMALLMLWEVDHQRSYPSVGGEGLSGALMGFSKRLQDRISKDTELNQWMVWKDMTIPLSPGLAPSYHRRWSVRVVAPREGEPRGWYDEFVTRWRAYLELLAQPRGARPLASLSEEQVARVRPGGRSLEERTRMEEEAPLRRLMRRREESEASPPGKKQKGKERVQPVRNQSKQSGKGRRMTQGKQPAAKRRKGPLEGWVRPETSTEEAVSSKMEEDSGGQQKMGHGRSAPDAPT